MLNEHWRRMPLRLLMALLLTGLFFHGKCYGHEGRPVFVDLTQTQVGQFTLRWKIPPVMPSGSEPSIQLIGQGCQQISTRYRASLTGSKLYNCEANSKGNLSVNIDYPNNNPALSSLIQFTQVSGESYSLFNGPDILSINLPKEVGFTQLAKQYIEAGLLHILEGYDHLLFVLCLMQIAGSLKRILITISGFTLAHSLTLALASLEIINVRIDIVEVLIALSIVMLCVEMAKKKNTPTKTSLIWQYPATVASLFGLLHGLGFASALGDLGLPQAMKLPALIFFNVGVEAGQVLFIAVVFTLLLMIKKMFTTFSQPINSMPTSPPRQASAISTITFPLSIIYLLGAVSGYWFVERCLGIFS
jgi:hydrogenase/urease accessory protein HupE